MVIVFGDASVFDFYSEYFSSYQEYVDKLNAFFGALEGKYSQCKLYYKPHPTDEGKIMPGVNLKRFRLFDDSVDAQAIFDKYQGKIKAIYALSSASTIMGSFFGVPSYTFYRYICNQEGVKKFDKFFNQDNIKSKFLFHLKDLAEIGKIDDLRPPKFIDLSKIDKNYSKVLNIK